VTPARATRVGAYSRRDAKLQLRIRGIGERVTEATSRTLWVGGKNVVGYCNFNCLARVSRYTGYAVNLSLADELAAEQNFSSQIEFRTLIVAVSQAQPDMGA
jgi:hypothetical protein